MFKWLPVYNFLVMFATLAYQAPFERLFGRYLNPDDKVCPFHMLLLQLQIGSMNSFLFCEPAKALNLSPPRMPPHVAHARHVPLFMCPQICNLPHLAGLYKMTGVSGRVLSLSARGAVADMLLWAISRVQTRVFASDSYRKCAVATLDQKRPEKNPKP